MSLVATRLSLTHTCTILRDANAGTVNGRGNPAPPDWQPAASGIPCRAWTTTGNERTENNEAILGFEDMRLLLQVGTDVTERDRIGDILDRGATYMAGPIGIRAVIRQRDFLELVLARITG